MGYDRPQGRDLPGHGAAIKPGKPLLYLGVVKQRRNGPAVSGLCSLRPCPDLDRALTWHQPYLVLAYRPPNG